MKSKNAQKTATCVVCGESFLSKRITAKYHAPKCRQRAFETSLRVGPSHGHHPTHCECNECRRRRRARKLGDRNMRSLSYDLRAELTKMRGGMKHLTEGDRSVIEVPNVRRDLRMAAVHLIDLAPYETDADEPTSEVLDGIGAALCDVASGSEHIGIEGIDRRKPPVMIEWAEAMIGRTYEMKEAA